MSRFTLAILLAVAAAMVLAAFAFNASHAQDALPARASGAPGGPAEPRPGMQCEVVLRFDRLESQERRWITPPRTSGSMAGSRDAILGELVKLNEEWVVVSLAEIQVDVEGNRVTTHGQAGERQRYTYWIPRRNVLYVRTWE